jgi:hypothetical protein
VAANLNRPRGRLGVRAAPGEACAARMQARSRTRARVRLGHGRRVGDDRRAPPVSHCGCGRGSSGPAALRMLGRLGRAAVLGCDAVNQTEEKEVHRRTSSCWAARRNGPE